MSRLWIKKKFHLIYLQTLKFKNILKMNLDLMEFFQEIIYLEKIKDGAYVINLDEYVKHWIALFCTEIEVIYFDSFRVEHVPKDTEKFIEHKNIKTDVFRIQTNNSIMSGSSCIGFIDFMFPSKILIDYTSFFSPYELKKK